MQTIVDYISGKTVKATPEEIEATQPFSRQLVEDYGYPKENIITHPQFRVQASPSSTNKSYPVDIAVMRLRDAIETEPHIIVECKRRNRNDGIKQLQLYMGMSSAQLGVWFNGEERAYYRKKISRSGTNYIEIPNIPKYGERVEDLGRFKRSDLSTPHNLGTVFNSLRNRLAANNVGVARDEALARQLINLIFCKIYDEKFTKPSEQVSFRVGMDENAISVQNRIFDLFDKVLNQYSTVFDDRDTLDLDSNSILTVVGELQQYCLLDASRDAIAEAFEVFIGKALKGENGQFFTPRNVVELVIKILKPAKDAKVIDPACGSGGFLIESMRYMWAQIESEGEEFGWSRAQIETEKAKAARSNIFGIDKDGFLAKVTKAYMTLIGDGTAGIACENSLEIPRNWSTNTQNQIKLGEFDIVVTNPPFGSKKLKVEGKELLSQYDLAHKWKINKTSRKAKKQTTLRTKVAPQILFIERCLQLLKDGGKLAIVLPETNVHAPTLTYVVEFLKLHCCIEGVLDLPHNTFRPYCNAKTVVIFLRKKASQKRISMYVAEEMGHNHLGAPIYRWNSKKREFTNEIWDDLSRISDEIAGNSSQKYSFTVRPKDIRKNVLVPRYYWKSYDSQIEQIAESQEMRLLTMEALLQDGVLTVYKGHGSPEGREKGLGDVPYVRAADVIDWRLYKNPIAGVTEDVYERVKGKNGVSLHTGDIIFVKEGSYRIGDTAIVSADDKKILLNSHCLVFRIKKDNKHHITPFYFLMCLSHQIVKIQLKSKVLIDTTLPNIGDRWEELRIPIHISHDELGRVSEYSESVVREWWQAVRGLDELRESVSPLMMAPTST